MAAAAASPVGSMKPASSPLETDGADAALTAAAAAAGAIGAIAGQAQPAAEKAGQAALDKFKSMGNNPLGLSPYSSFDFAAHIHDYFKKSVLLARIVAWLPSSAADPALPSASAAVEPPLSSNGPSSTPDDRTAVAVLATAMSGNAASLRTLVAPPVAAEPPTKWSPKLLLGAIFRAVAAYLFFYVATLVLCAYNFGAAALKLGIGLGAKYTPHRVAPFFLQEKETVTEDFIANTLPERARALCWNPLFQHLALAGIDLVIFSYCIAWLAGVYSWGGGDFTDWVKGLSDEVRTLKVADRIAAFWNTKTKTVAPTALPPPSSASQD